MTLRGGRPIERSIIFGNEIDNPYRNRSDRSDKVERKWVCELFFGRVDERYGTIIDPYLSTFTASLTMCRTLLPK
jgi:hypothetical protein